MEQNERKKFEKKALTSTKLYNRQKNDKNRQRFDPFKVKSCLLFTNLHFQSVQDKIWSPHYITIFDFSSHHDLTRVIVHLKEVVRPLSSSTAVEYNQASRIHVCVFK